MDPSFYNNILDVPLSSFYPAMKGGATIAIAATLYYMLFGNILGMSGLAGSIVKFPTQSATKLKTIILMGMMCASALILTLYSKSKEFRQNMELPFDSKSMTDKSSLTQLIVAGFLVGVGTDLSNGCTSGHGLCGMPRLSVRSLAAVVTFLGTALVTATLSFSSYIPELSFRSSAIDNLSIPPEYFMGFAVGAAIFLMIIENQKSMIAKVTLFMIGMVFGFGLMIAGMSQREKIFGFLKLNASWDPSLLFVLMTGVLINAFTFNLIIAFMNKPAYGEKIENPKGSVTGRLLLGAVLFGLGWGIGGLCPGPFIISIPYSMKIAIYWGIPFFLGQKLSNVFLADNHVHVLKDAANKMKSS